MLSALGTQDVVGGVQAVNIRRRTSSMMRLGSDGGDGKGWVRL